jgi:hypothetical protein
MTAGLYVHARAVTEQRKENHMAKLIQICASQNDLFALDADGIVCHYNFNTNTWMRLGHGQRDHRDSPAADGGRTIPAEALACARDAVVDGPIVPPRHGQK